MNTNTALTQAQIQMISEQNKFRKHNTDKIEQSWRLDGGDKSQDLLSNQFQHQVSSSRHLGLYERTKNLGKKYM